MVTYLLQYMSSLEFRKDRSKHNTKCLVNYKTFSEDCLVYRSIKTLNDLTFYKPIYETSNDGEMTGKYFKPLKMQGIQGCK